MSYLLREMISFPGERSIRVSLSVKDVHVLLAAGKADSYQKSSSRFVLLLSGFYCVDESEEM
jgi:hypothetical protein